MLQSSSPYSLPLKSTTGRAKKAGAQFSSLGSSGSGASGQVPGSLPGPARAVLGGFSRLAPKAAAGLAETLFLTPLRIKSPWREEWWATDAEDIVLRDGSGRPLQAWRWGTGGPTVLLVHGWGGRGLQMGAFAAPLVEAGFQVVAFDGPGHGKSSGRRSSLPDFATAVSAVVEQLGGVHGIVAHSFGAAATTFSRAGREEVGERLVFVAPASSFSSIKRQFSQLTGFTTDVVGHMQGRIEQRYGIRWQEVEPQGLASGLKMPLLVFHDEQDVEIPWQDSRRLTELWPDSRFELTQGLGHHRILREQHILDRTVAFMTEPGV